MNLKMKPPTTNNNSSLYLLFFAALLVLPAQVQGFTCTSANATPSDPNGADPNQIAETGCRIFNSCTSSKRTVKRVVLRPKPRQEPRQVGARQVGVGASAITCPDTYGCYSLTTNGGLFCLDVNSFDYITADGVCGNIMAGSQYVCGSGSSGGSGNGNSGSGGGGAGSASGSASGAGTGNAGGRGSGSGSGESGNGSGSGSNGNGGGNGNGSGNGNGNGNGNGAGKPNGATSMRTAGNDKITNSFLALVAFFVMLQVI